MNSDHTLRALGMPLHGDSITQNSAAVDKYAEAVGKFDAEQLDEVINEQYRQAGCIAMSAEEYLASESGRANSHIELYEISKAPSTGEQGPSWWPENTAKPSSVKRPLAGLKVVDLTRVIAGPTITRELAEMGASVMRVTAPNITDLSSVHHDLNWGKWNCHLDLHSDADKLKLEKLIREADVVVDGYRPGIMEKHGFGRDAIFNLVKDRSRGIIHVRENCYGWYGPWAHRSGWQQISDAVSGNALHGKNIR